MKTITLLQEDFSKVTTPQVKVILNTLSENAKVNEDFPMSKLIELVDANPNFVSRQGAARVIRFYEKSMIENGWVKTEGSDKPEKSSLNDKKADAANGQDGKRRTRKAKDGAGEKEGAHGGAHAPAE